MRFALAFMMLCGIARADDGDVRPVLVANCPDCHTRSSPKSVKKALAVFDTDDPYPAFAARMSPAQLDKMNGRMAQKPTTDRARVAAFVLEEKARRAAP